MVSIKELTSKIIQKYSGDDSFTLSGFIRYNASLFVVMAFFAAVAYYLINLSNSYTGSTDDVLKLGVASSFIALLFVAFSILMNILSYNGETEKNLEEKTKPSVSNSIINTFVRLAFLVIFMLLILEILNFLYIVYLAYIKEIIDIISFIIVMFTGLMLPRILDDFKDDKINILNINIGLTSISFIIGILFLILQLLNPANINPLNNYFFGAMAIAFLLNPIFVSIKYVLSKAFDIKIEFTARIITVSVIILISIVLLYAAIAFFNPSDPIIGSWHPKGASENYYLVFSDNYIVYGSNGTTETPIASWQKINSTEYWIYAATMSVQDNVVTVYGNTTVYDLILNKNNTFYLTENPTVYFVKK
jgi:hypothetical protein